MGIVSVMPLSRRRIMQENRGTFERRGTEEAWLKFRQDGTEEGLPKIPSGEVLDAIARAQDIDIEYAIIEGALDIRNVADRLERNEDGKLLVNVKVSISRSVIRGNAGFWAATFSRYADFRGATFSGHAGFRGATFSGHADFGGAAFSRDAYFGDAAFSGHAGFWNAAFSEHTEARFAGVSMERPADFADVEFRENKVLSGLWNDALRPLIRPVVWLLTVGKLDLREKVFPVTGFWDMNTTVVMDGASNPYLKRYIDDEEWIRSWRERSWARKAASILWELTSHCGRSIGLWGGWSAIFAVSFAFIYWGFGSNHITFDVGRLNGIQPGFLGYVYYSVVTFTTLGFGDIVPLTNWARLAVGAEVVLGYIMLGGLISIFANKLARRS